MHFKLLVSEVRYNLTYYRVPNGQKFAYYCISYAYNKVSNHYSLSYAHKMLSLVYNLLSYPYYLGY